MPDGQPVKNGQSQQGLSKVKEHRLNQSFFAERGEDDGKRKIHGIDRTYSQYEAALRPTWKPQQAGKSLEGFDLQYPGAVSRQCWPTLSQLDFLAAAGNVLFLGQPGTGKSHLAIGIRACLAGQRMEQAERAPSVVTGCPLVCKLALRLPGVG